MRSRTRLAAAIQLMLIFPAALFLTAVLVGLGDPPQHGLADGAHRVVKWYSTRAWTLPLLLVALPAAALATGGAVLLRTWNTAVPLVVRPSLATIPAPMATLLVGWATITSAVILVIVALHVAAN